MRISVRPCVAGVIVWSRTPSASPQAAVVAPREAPARMWDEEPTQTDATRDEIVAYLRAAWFMLEAMGLAALAPERLQEAVDHSTVFSGAGTLEPFV